ncbi:MAG TPA: hypothetical protein VMT38_05065 [Terracidiphilus sp.]|nr:hypothetical protein [Terracidiphilus sp.]
MANCQACIDDALVVCFRARVHGVAELVGFKALRGFSSPGAGEPAARKWTPREHADALIDAEAGHLALFFAIEQVVVVLHGDEARPAVQVGHVERLRELPRKHGRCPDVARLSSFHDVVQGFHRLFDGCVVIPAVNLVEVNVVGLEPAKALVDFEEDFLARKAFAVGLVAHHALQLGGDDDGLTARVRFQEAADDGFAFAAGINIGGVEEVDSKIEGLAKKRLAVGLVQCPFVTAGQRRSLGGAAVGHAAEANAGNFQASAAKIDVIHNGS